MPENAVNQDYGFSITLTPSVTSAPEPESYAMFLAGLGLIGFMVRHTK
jgi:hypothetical protein